MPRANRISGEGGIFHLSHRCHDQAFHLRLARGRNSCREKMRNALRIDGVALLDAWILEESPIPYGGFRGPESERSVSKPPLGMDKSMAASPLLW